MKTFRVVTSFIVKAGRVLILRRSGKVGSYRGKWSAISGYLEDHPLNQAYREINEELSISGEDLKLLATGDPMEVLDEDLGVRWVVYPFLFEFIGEDSKIKLNWENLEAKWVKPEEIKELETVPDLYRILRGLWAKAYQSPSGNGDLPQE
ncbi:MAG: NUDIX domain-containing protein [Candidatus Bathyarchaeia archaeon]|nr:NUDIX domain-containing protein [Candidatus Bathyarchaeota archaeon]